MASDIASSTPMLRRRRLRWRIIVSFLLFGTTLTALFAGATLVVRELLEEQLIEGTLQHEVDNYVEQIRQDPTGAGAVPYAKIRGRIFSTPRFANVPFSRRDLDTGVHDLVEFDEAGRLHHLKVAVRKDADLWAFLEYDLTEEKLNQRTLIWLLGGSVAVFSLLSFVIGWWFSRRVMSPVTELAERIEHAATSGTPTPLAEHFADDEVGALAAALDDYSRRLTELVVRDREFNSDVSHELRTPLAVIRSATELMQSMPDLPEKARQRLQRIERAARQSTELIEALLHLSRAERQAPTDGEHTDVRAVVESVLESHRFQMGNKPLDLSVEQTEPVRVRAPEAVLAVALGNLVGNAIKYTPSGSVRVLIGKGSAVVEDTGPGVKADELPKLFDRHFRGSDAGGKGAGLGLAIVHRLCDLYGWSVSVAPREGGGLRAELHFDSRSR